MKIRLCYRLEKQLEMAVDENGEAIEAFLCCKIDVKKDPIPSEEYKCLVDGFRKILANHHETDEKYIVPITLNEYLNETEEDEDQ